MINTQPRRENTEQTRSMALIASNCGSEPIANLWAKPRKKLSKAERSKVECTIDDSFKSSCAPKEGDQSSLWRLELDRAGVIYVNEE